MASKVLVVDDVADFRMLVRTALRLQGEFDVVAEAGTGAAAIEAAVLHRPDLIVLDLGLPDMPASQVVRRLREECDARIVVFTGQDVDGTVAFEAAVEGLVRKSGDLEFLVHLLQNLAAAGRQSAALSLPMAPSAAKAARDFVIEHCRAWSCEDAIDAATLVVSELVTNAVLHAHSRPQLLLSHHDRTLRLEVVDDSSASPEPRTPDVWDEGGRGLLLVGAFSAAWGIDPTRAGKRIWAELPCRSLLPA